jgi:glycosyltransferase involved in cell wall biosynthesis
LAAVRKYITPLDELIVVDGNSEDETGIIVDRYKDIVDTFISEPDLGAAHAFNKGMMLAEGKYVRPVSDDDILHPEGMKQAVQVLDQHPEVDVIVCGGTKQYTDESSFEVWLPPGVNYGSSTEDVFRHKGSGAGLVIRRSALPLTGLVPSSLAADHEYLLESIYRGAVVKFCRINLYHHLIHENSYTMKYGDDFIKDEYRLLRQYCSVKFYYYVRLKWLLRRHPGWQRLADQSWKFLMLPMRAWNKGLRMLRSDRTQQKPVRSFDDHKTERWDAGFS